jgi:predicted kinase
MTTRPVAVFIGGPPASGKTTLAQAVAPALHAVVLDLDVVTGPLTDLVLRLTGAADLSEPQIAELTREPRYRTLLSVAEQAARAGASSVVVAPFGAERDVARWAQTVDGLRPFADPCLIWLTLAPEQLAGRLAGRAAPRDAAKLRDPARFTAAVDLSPPTAPHLRLDAARPVSELATAVIRHVRALPSMA